MNAQEIKAAAELIVEGIRRDFTDRRGLRQEWEQIDDDIQKEILAKWKSIAEAKIRDVLFTRVAE